jgi:hypothetical protein
VSAAAPSPHPVVLRDESATKRRPESKFLGREVAKGPGHSHADRGLKYGDCKGVIFAPGCNLNAFYEAFMTVMIAFA